jgi:hypothetical protein
MKKGLFIFMSTFAISSSAQAVVPGHLMDAIYNWPVQLWQSDVNMTILSDPGPTSTYYWSHFFVFANSDSSWSRAGYTGLQTVGNGKKAIFSIWNGLAASGQTCQPFSGEGVGYQCFIDYDFAVGHTYRLRIWQLASDSTGVWWGGFVSDTATNAETVIGYIKTPSDSGLIKTSFLFDEYFTNVSSCAAMPYAKVEYSNLTGNLGAVTPNFSSWYPGSACKNNIFVQFTGNNFTAASPTS